MSTQPIGWPTHQREGWLGRLEAGNPNERGEYGDTPCLNETMTLERRATVRQIEYRDAINEAMAEEMERDPKVILYGLDVGALGGLHGVTRGLLDRFGKTRVMDMPISEEVIAGMSGGMAASGYRPIVELMFAGLIGSCFSQLFYTLGFHKDACPNLPIVVRLPMGSEGGGDNALHVHCPESLLMHAPYLKVVAPSNPYDAKGLLKTAIRGNSPVMFMEHKGLYHSTGPVPSEEYLVPFGEALVKRPGNDVTLVSYSAMVSKCVSAADTLHREGIEAEVIDLRTLVPLDEQTIINSVKKTGRLVIVHEAMGRSGPAAEIACVVAEKGFGYLRAPIRRVTAPNSGVRPDFRVEKGRLPQAKDIHSAAMSLIAKDWPQATDRGFERIR